eukprot:TRINITY_DN33549_c0_g1_i1.p1 TRINITY_DN33549_c0_g1~~TRINITY_DN33549_c0_g1_i1.p1  ORF type:complete len:469 (-),score=54.86 TRINITY_DN33549_c0_g1_i1:138-1544(-)
MALSGANGGLIAKLLDDFEDCEHQAFSRSSQSARHDFLSSRPGGDAEGAGSVFSSAVALVTTCVGTGLLALPFAFSSGGVVLGFAMLVVFALLSGYTSYILCQSCEWGHCFSYGEVMVAAFGRSGAHVLEAIVIWLLLGAMTSLLVVVGDALTLALSFSDGFALFAGILGPFFPPRAILILGDLVLVALPLSCMQSTHALRYSNATALILTTVVIVAVVTRGLSTPVGWEVVVEHQNMLVGQAALQALPIVMLSLGCQIQVPGIYRELKQRSPSRMKGVLVIVALTCTALYTTIAISGILIAGERLEPHSQAALHVPGNVLDCFPATDRVGLVVHICMAIAVTLVYPVLCLPCRDTIDHFISTQFDMKSQPLWVARLKHAGLTLLIVAITLLLETQAGSLAGVFGFTGATAGTLICYVLPILCYLQLRQRQSKATKDATRGHAVLCTCMLAIVVPLGVMTTLASMTRQ